MSSKVSYQAQYYRDHRKVLLAKRKKRYAEDEVYRETVKKRARHRHKVLHQGGEAVGNENR